MKKFILTVSIISGIVLFLIAVSWYRSPREMTFTIDMHAKDDAYMDDYSDTVTVILNISVANRIFKEDRACGSIEVKGELYTLDENVFHRAYDGLQYLKKLYRAPDTPYSLTYGFHFTAYQSDRSSVTLHFARQRDDIDIQLLLGDKDGHETAHYYAFGSGLVKPRYD